MGKLSDFENTSFNSFEITSVSEGDDSDPVTNLFNETNFNNSETV